MTAALDIHDAIGDIDVDALDHGQRLVLEEALQELARRGVIELPRIRFGPKTDEELLDAVEELTGRRIPRVAVCEGHVAPAQTFCDLYFDRADNVLWIGPRGGGKSLGSSYLHGAKNRWNPGYSSAVAGAIAKQGQRLYAEFQRFTRTISDEIVDSLQSKTEWVNGSITEVLTACLPSKAKIVTDQGDMEIGRIVRERREVNVRSYDFRRGVWEWKPIVDWHEMGSHEGRDWITLKYEFGPTGPHHAIMTPNHNMIRPNGEDVAAEDLVVGDELCVPAWRPSGEQEQILLGALMGDGSLARTGWFRYDQNKRQRAFLDWLEDAFSEIDKLRREAPGKDTENVSLKVQRRFHELRKAWYDRPQPSRSDPDKLWHGKQVPPGALDAMDELGLAVWLMGDGCYALTPGTGARGFWYISTIAFDDQSRGEIESLFDRMGLDYVWQSYPTGGYSIRFDADSSDLITAMVHPWLRVDEKQEKGWKRWVAPPIGEHGHEGLYPARVTEIGKTKLGPKSYHKSDKRYDITVEGNHNYLLKSGLLSHNTIKGMNSPHPRMAQLDEAELVGDDVFEEFLNMAQGEGPYQAQQLLTSTRKYAFGTVQKKVKESEAAIKKGQEPPWRIDIYCVFEALQNQPNCRSAPENSGRPEEELCQCHKVVKGEWDDGTVRSFDQVCGGRAYRSDGFQPIKNAHNRFRQLAQMTWEAQQECLSPDVEGLVHKWVRPRHRLRRWAPHPALGPVYRGWDWGGNNPNAVVWLQKLEFAVAIDAEGKAMLREDDDREPAHVIPQGAIVQFDEIYRTADDLPGDGGWSDLGELVARREQQWRSIPSFADMRILADVCDPAGLVGKREARKGFKKAIDDGCALVQIPDFKSRPLRVADSVRFHISLGEGDLMYYVPDMCPGADAEYESYRWPDSDSKKNDSEEPIKKNDHCLAGGTGVWTRRGTVPIEEVTTEDEVMTRDGWRRVTWSGQTGVRPTHPVELDDGTVVRVTDDHPIRVVGQGFVTLDAIRYSSWSWRSSIDRWMSRRGLIVFRRWNTGESFTDAIRILRTEACVATSPLRVRTAVAAIDCIARSGSTLAGLYRRVITSITSTATPATIGSRISNAFRRPSISRDTRGLAIATSCGPSWPTPPCTHERGTDPTKADGSTASSNPPDGPRRLGSTSEAASNAKSPSRSERSASPRGRDSVLTRARRRLVASRASTTKSASVWCANGLTSSTSIDAAHAAPDLVERSIRTIGDAGLPEPVYDLTVEGAHEFFAEGLLVGNCMDAIRYTVFYIENAPQVSTSAPGSLERESAPTPGPVVGSATRRATRSTSARGKMTTRPAGLR